METSELKQANASETSGGLDHRLSSAAATSFGAEAERRRDLFAATPSRRRSRRLSLLVRPTGSPSEVAKLGETVLDLRRDRASSASLAKERAAALEWALQLLKGGGGLALRLSRDGAQARAELQLFLPQLKTGLQDVLIDATTPEEIWAIDDALAALEREHSLPLGHIGIQLALKSLAAIMDIERLATCTPRISALELAPGLAGQLGWVFSPAEDEDSTAALIRRITEAESAVRPAFDRVLLIARSHGIPLVHGALPVESDPAILTKLAPLLACYDGLRLTSAAEAQEADKVLPQSSIDRRLESLESYAQSRTSNDPAVAYRFDEDAQALDEAVRHELLTPEAQARYWRAKWNLLVEEGEQTSFAIPDQTVPQALLEAVRKNTHAGFRYRFERVSEDGTKRIMRSDVPLSQILRNAANQVARALAELGIAKGDRVAIYCGNTLAHLATSHAISLLGAIAVPLDMTMAHRVHRVLRDAEVKAVLLDVEGQPDSSELHYSRLLAWAREHGQETNRTFWSELQQCREKIDAEDAIATMQRLQASLPQELQHAFWEAWELRLGRSFKINDDLLNVPSLKAVLLTSKEDFVPHETPSPMEEVVSALASALGEGVRVALLRELAATFSESDFEPQAKPDDPILWVYCGFEEDAPCAVYHTHRSLLALALAAKASMIPRGHWVRNVVASTLPFAQLGGLVAGFLAPALAGSDILIVPNFSEDYHRSLAYFVVNESVTALFSSPQCLAGLAGNLPRQADVKNLRRIANLYGRLPREVADLCSQHFNQTPCDGYGTVGNPLLLLSPNETNRLGTSGIPYPNLDARIVDPASGKSLTPRTVGALEVRGPQLTPGIARPPEGAGPLLAGEGWLRTHARFSLDSDGYFVFVEDLC